MFMLLVVCISFDYVAGLAAFPSADRLSPLDTFLDLLTAKGTVMPWINLTTYWVPFSPCNLNDFLFTASLAELDFGLLIEATVTSTDEFLEWNDIMVILQQLFLFLTNL